MNRVKRPYLERLAAKLQQRTRSNGDCVEWTAAVSGGGYGVLRLVDDGGNTRNVPAHRAAWLVAYGELPRGAFVCHMCDNRRCVNPKHLFLGTQKANLIDCAKKGRIRNAKLTRGQAAEIFQSSATYVELAARFGISQHTVREIRKRRHYAWATRGLIRGSRA